MLSVLALLRTEPQLPSLYFEKKHYVVLIALSPEYMVLVNFSDAKTNKVFLLLLEHF